MPLSKPMMTVDEVADLTRLTARTIRTMIHNGDLKAVKFGKEYRIPEAFLTEYLEKHLTVGPEPARSGR